MSNPTLSQNRTYAESVKERVTSKPIFIKEYDVFGTVKPSRHLWLTHVELYKCIAGVIAIECLVGLQRVNSMWRIYVDNDDTRFELISKGLVVRDKAITVYSSNPGLPNYGSDTIPVRVKNVPLSADDGQIKRAIALHDTSCELINIYRERLRVDGKLTNCETGDRIVIVKNLKNPLPALIEVGKYRAVVKHRGQPNEKATCNNCLQQGHQSKDCPNEKVCRSCKHSGHIQANCPEIWSKDRNGPECSSDESDTESSSSSSDNASYDTVHEMSEAEVPLSSSTSSVSTTDIIPDNSTASTTWMEEDAEVSGQSNKTSVKTQGRKKLRGKSKGRRKHKSGPQVQSTTQTSQKLLDNFLNTSSRKSSSLGPEVRSPPSSLDVKEKRSKN